MRIVCRIHLQPSRNATGINTADITIVIATTAPAISFVAVMVASRGLRPSSILTWTASTTTMALSTTIPIARTSANNVSRLMEKSNVCIKANVPTKATGTAPVLM